MESVASLLREIHFFSVTRLAPEDSADDYRKGQRPPQFLIIDRIAVKRERESFLRHQTSRGSRVLDSLACILYIRVYTHALEDAGVFATSIYSDYSGARLSVDRDGNKFDKSIRSAAATTRSSLSTLVWRVPYARCGVVFVVGFLRMI